jgi:hypothetical protein
MIRSLFGLFLAVTVIGCTNIQAVGPFAKGSMASKMTKDVGPPDPVMVPAPTPTPPKCIVRPEDVNTDSAASVQQQLKAELEADQKNMPSVPVTAEISEIRGSINTRGP